MQRRAPSSALWVVLIMGVSLVAGCDPDANPLAEESAMEILRAGDPAHAPAREPLTVMTRNIYVGGDILRIFEANFDDPFSVMVMANTIWNQIQATRFEERAVALVDEIEAADPDLMGIQEAARYEHLEVTPFGLERTVSDFLEILQDEIDRRNLPYSVLAVQENTSTMVPLAATIMDGALVFTEVVAFTERVAVLVRNDFPVQGVSHENYETTLSPGGGIVQKRGWIRVDAQVGGTPHHFVVTHLEVQAFPAAQLAQARELLDEVATGLDGVTFLLGDFNSNVAGAPGDPTWTPTYDAIVDAGFRDLWASAYPGRRVTGLTCCNDGDLLAAEPTFYERVDFIFFRSSEPWGKAAHFPGALAMDMVGDDPTMRTGPHGLWPSDHAGLVAHLWGGPGLWR